MIIGFRCTALLALLYLFFLTPTQAQSFFADFNQEYLHSKALSSSLKQWEVYQLDASALSDAVKRQATPEIIMGSHTWRLNLISSHIVSPEYHLQIIAPEGKQEQHNLGDIAFQGYETNSGGRARLTLTDNFIYGYVSEANDTYYIEPLWYYEPTAAPDLFVVYANNAVIPNVDARCAVLEMKEKSEHFRQEQNQSDTPETISACYELDLAIASDKSMYIKYGSSVTNVQNHNIGVINNVQGDYIGEFTNDIQFNIVTQVVITGTDPWLNETDAEALLVEFVDWGNAGGFSVPFDLGELWTNRNFDGATVGVAYLDAVCTFVRYHCLQDFTSNAQQLRCMTTHEIGHNFSCDHDPENGNSCPPSFIMCPFVSTTSTWSNASRNSVNSFSNFLINSGCLSPCAGAVPLSADFSWSPNPACQNQNVQFTDLSTGNITGRSWTFQGAVPATSTQQNPSANWSNAGTYNVTLTVSGPGGPSSVTKQVVIAPKPVADFSFTVQDNTVTFNNLSTNANTYFWNFGNGFTSSETNPQITYPVSGIYSVILTATNSCGTSTKTISVRTAPTANFNASPLSGCTPLSVQFTNQTIGGQMSSYDWQFPGGTPATSTSTNPTVIYNTAGTFDVMLTATNSAGSNTKVKESFIVTQAPPVAGFTWQINAWNIQFTNTSTYATSYTWNFGDGNSSAETNPSHQYDTSGIYTITLTVSGTCGTRTFTRSIQLEEVPVPGFSADVTSGCGPLTVSFSNQSSANTDSIVWLFPGGNPATSTAANPVVTYTEPGTYAVTQTVSNEVGNNSLTQQNLTTVAGAPTPGFNTTTTGLSASFENTSLNALSYLWNFGDGSPESTETNPNHTYLADGVYTITLTATNICGSQVTTQSITIISAPTAGFSAAQTMGCGPLTIQFNNQSSSNATSFQWQFPGGNPATSTAANPIVTYDTHGTYSVSLTVGNAAGNDSFSQTDYIEVFSLPSVGFSTATEGLTATFSNSSQNSQVFLWNFGDVNSANNSSTETHPSHTYTEDGIYMVTLTVSNNCGAASYSQMITIVTPPTALFSGSEDKACAGTPVAFQSISSENTTALEWVFEGGEPASATSNNPVVLWSQPGVYSVTLTASNTSGSSTSTASVTITGPPTAGFVGQTAGLSVVMQNTSAGASSYNWNFGDPGSGAADTSTAAMPIHQYAGVGTYVVTLTAANACGADTFAIAVFLTITDAPEQQAWNVFRIFPNPNAGQFTLEMGGVPRDQVEFVLYNALGQQLIVETADFHTGTLLYLFDYRDLPAAMYTLQVRAGSQSRFVKIAVQR
jgi:PKD repeat protein